MQLRTANCELLHRERCSTCQVTRSLLALAPTVPHCPRMPRRPSPPLVRPVLVLSYRIVASSPARRPRRSVAAVAAGRSSSVGRGAAAEWRSAALTTTDELAALRFERLVAQRGRRSSVTRPAKSVDPLSKTRLLVRSTYLQRSPLATVSFSVSACRLHSAKVVR